MAGIDKYSTNSWSLPQDSNLYQNVAEDETTAAVSNSLTSRSLSPDKDALWRNYINTSVGIVSLVAENLVCHPFIVLRRQCQVHNNSLKYHLFPITLIPVVCHLHKHQGISTLWKGIGSTLLVRGLSLGIEDLLSKITPWPKELSRHSSVKSFFQHTLLKR